VLSDSVQAAYRDFATAEEECQSVICDSSRNSTGTNSSTDTT